MPKLLVVDDNLLALRLFSEALATLGIDCVTAVDARSALAASAAAAFDLLLIDARLPDQPGTAVLAAIRNGNGPSRTAPALATTLGPEQGALAHLVFVPNPAQHAGGDFTLKGNTVTLAHGGPTHTYAGIGIFRPAFFAGVCPNTPLKLRPLLDAAIPRGHVQGERHTGRWTDVGTPERLAELDRQLHTPISS